MDQQQLIQLIKGVGSLLSLILPYDGVELIIHLVNGIGGLEMDLDTGIVGLQRHIALDHHDYRDISVTGKRLLAADKAVNTGALGDGTDIGGQKNVQESEIGISFLDLLATILINMRNVKAV